MATTTLIDPTNIPSGRGGTALLTAEATSQLQDALRTNHGLEVRLDPAERATTYIKTYRNIADTLGFALAISRGPQRSYTTKAGKPRTEAGILYIRIIKKPAERRPISIGPDRREFEPITRAEISR